MAEVRIKPLKNGPLEVSGGVDVVDADGNIKPEPKTRSTSAGAATRPTSRSATVAQEGRVSG
jgi:hypothetical protein